MVKIRIEKLTCEECGGSGVCESYRAAATAHARAPAELTRLPMGAVRYGVLPVKLVDPGDCLFCLGRGYRRRLRFSWLGIHPRRRSSEQT